MKKRLILILALISLVIIGLPLIIFGIDKTFFYELDPDVVYVTNSILYTTARIIPYLDHPGTPTMVLLSYLFVPLRLAAKFIFHKQFIDWTFDNYIFLTFYLRVFQLFLSTLSIFVFLKTIKSLANSVFLILIAFFLTISFAGFTVAISPENFSLFLTVIWLAIFLKFIKSPRYIFIAIMVLISGFAFANKFTNLFLAFPAILLPLLLDKEKFGRKIILIESNMALFAQGFVIGIWPVLNKFSAIYNWGLTLFDHTDAYGGGLNKAFDWGAYSVSMGSLIRNYPITIAFVCLTFLLAIFLVLTKKLRIFNPVVILTVTTFLGFLVFSKYSTIRYQDVNVLLLIFCFIYFLTKLKATAVRIILPVSALIFIFLSIGNWTMAAQAITSNMNKNRDVYGLLKVWTEFWSADLFRDQFARLPKP